MAGVGVVGWQFTAAGRVNSSTGSTTRKHADAVLRLVMLLQLLTLVVPWVVAASWLACSCGRACRQQRGQATTSKCAYALWLNARGTCCCCW